MSPGTAGGGYEPRLWRLAEGPVLRPCEASDLRNLYQCLVNLARWRATEYFRMSDPDWLTSDHKILGPNTSGLILRIFVVAFLGLLFWHTVIAAGNP
jgi:hypothetical protein